MWVKSKIIKQKLELSNQALYERKKRGLIKTKTTNNIRYYWLDDEEQESEKVNVIYCRVSNTKQIKDLEKQEKILREYATSTGHIVEYVFKDIASGMNEERREFNLLLDLVFNNKVNKIFISYKDRLTRFGYKYFENIFGKFNTKIEVVNLTTEKDFQEELTEDLISIIHHFSMKMYSNRRKQLKKTVKQLKELGENN
jgi:predicted site-specific integrase-resolvase